MELPSRDTTTAPPSLATGLDSARHLRHASGTAPLGRDNPVNYSQPHPREAKFTRVAPNLVKAAVEGRLPRGIGIERLRDPPTEWSRQFEALGLNPE
jgi:hypothetical protein